jgi:hypothetical protein
LGHHEIEPTEIQRRGPGMRYGLARGPQQAFFEHLNQSENGYEFKTRITIQDQEVQRKLVYKISLVQFSVHSKLLM